MDAPAAPAPAGTTTFALLCARERLRMLNPPSAGEICGVDAREEAWLEYPECVVFCDTLGERDERKCWKNGLLAAEAPEGTSLLVITEVDAAEADMGLVIACTCGESADIEGVDCAGTCTPKWLPKAANRRGAPRRRKAIIFALDTGVDRRCGTTRRRCRCRIRADRLRRRVAARVHLHQSCRHVLPPADAAAARTRVVAARAQPRRQHVGAGGQMRGIHARQAPAAELFVARFAVTKRARLIGAEVEGCVVARHLAMMARESSSSFRRLGRPTRLARSGGAAGARRYNALQHRHRGSQRLRRRQQRK